MKNLLLVKPGFLKTKDRKKAEDNGGPGRQRQSERRGQDERPHEGRPAHRQAARTFPQAQRLQRPMEVGAMIFDTPTACFNCCSEGGGFYKFYEGETQWHMGLDASGQAHYACKECSVLLFQARPIQTKRPDGPESRK